jgi:hypothetical protein
MSLWTKIKTTAKNARAWGSKALEDVDRFGHKLSKVAHNVLDKVDMVAKSSLGQEALTWLPFGNQVREGMSLAHKVVDYGDVGLGFVDKAYALDQGVKNMGLKAHIDAVDMLRKDDSTKRLVKATKENVSSIQKRRKQK